MSLSIQAEPLAPQAIAGGFVLVPARQLLFAWRSCQRSPLGIGDFRTWLASREMVARRCTIDDQRSPTYGFAELARLTGVSPKRTKASVDRLVAAGLLARFDQLIEFPEPGDPDDNALADSIGGGRGSIAIPRRILRLLIGGAKPALIATVIAILLRCLARGRGGFRPRGRVKASWIAKVFNVDIRRVKQARKELIDLGWITPDQSDQWAMNRWGPAYIIDLAWERTAPAADGPRLPPPPAADGPRLPPPDLQTPIPFGREKNQEPAPGGPVGVQIQPGGTGEIPPPPGSPAPAPSPLREKREQGPAHRRPPGVATGAGGGPLRSPRLADVRIEDLRDMGRLLEMHEQAVAGGQIGPSEADRLRFVAAAEHARSIGTVNPPGLFAWLLRGRRWTYLTQDDEDAASRRLKAYLFGPPRGGGGGGVSTSSMTVRPRLSADGQMVGEVRTALARAGYGGDPFPLVRARDGSWTRERWDAALADFGAFCGGF